MPNQDQSARNIHSSEQAVPFGAFARLGAAIFIAFLAAVLIAISAFRSDEEKQFETAVSPVAGTKPEVNPFRP